MNKPLSAALAALLLLSTPAIALAAPARRTVQLTVTKEGFVPAEVKVRKGEPLKLVITRTVERTCATEIVLQGTGIKKDLPLGQAVELDFTPTKTGPLKYACAMGMIGGVLLVE